ncbi:SRPBCC family protein [Streptomyces sp. NBC_01351]|uniref:SRPBCC family protein n=1 Tax=Streptomyces sp. NBC_01351 TaxID=2903833 RepID=UPI002E33B0DA|nr:SRPBCC family protein [Streptomyces sp. NBC_01351]
MPVIRIVHQTPLPASEAWERLTDWAGHGTHVPLTRMIIETAGQTRAGTIFTARTGVGRITFDDRMEVTVWQPPAGTAPGLVRLEKRGRVVTGWAEIAFRPSPGGGTEIHWTESLRLRPLPRVLDPLVGKAGHHLFARAMTRLLAP